MNYGIENGSLKMEMNLAEGSGRISFSGDITSEFVSKRHFVRDYVTPAGNLGYNGCELTF
jgi:hypothetical protein